MASIDKTWLVGPIAALGKVIYLELLLMRATSSLLNAEVLEPSDSYLLMEVNPD